jgi:hypothetical protein
MRNIAKRLHRLEEQFGPEVETAATRYVRMRIEEARLRCGLPPISPERLAELRGMSLIEILNSGRQKARQRELERREREKCELEQSAPECDY